MESGNWEIAALNRLWFFRCIFQAAQSCLHCSHFPLAPAPPLILQTMKWAFEPVPAPLPSSCFLVLRGTWWRAAVLAALEVPPSCLVLRLEQSTKCLFSYTALAWEERHALGTLTQRHRVGKASNMLLVRADRAGVSAERNLVLPEERSYPGDLRGSSPCCPPKSNLLMGKRCWTAAGGSMACLPPQKGLR